MGVVLVVPRHVVDFELFVHLLCDAQGEFVLLRWQTESVDVNVNVEYNDPDVGLLLDVDRAGDGHQLTQWC